MKVNDLVLHAKKTNLGIGCIAKLGKVSHSVNFGTTMTMKVKPDLLNIIDTSHCKTVAFRDYANKILMGENNPCPDIVIVGNEIKHFVGIGWITPPNGVITLDDLSKYPRVI